MHVKSVKYAKKNFYLANNTLTYLIIPNENKAFDIRSRMKIETTL